MEITEDYISFDTAKLLKEKGFDLRCQTWYVDEEINYNFTAEQIKGWANRNMPKGEYCRPTQALVLKWLRVVHGIFINTILSYTYRGKTRYEIRIENRPYRSSGYKSPEEATEVAIQYTLKNLLP